MTERIDLDDVEVETPDDDAGNDGDWLWRDDDGPDGDDIEGDVTSDVDADVTGDVDADVAGDVDADVADDVDTDSSRVADSSAGGDDSSAGGGDSSAGDSQGSRIPHVPREGSDSPAGIPKDRGGAGAGAGGDSERGRSAQQKAADTERESTDAEAELEGTERQSKGSAASGPHGGGVDEMATAYTYEAVQRLADPRIALGETNEWSDWVGLVGDVPAHAINSFLREHQLDIDFFNGSGDGPAERLAAIDEHSMFYAERMVVVGTADERWIAEQAGWEFVALPDAAENAGWSLAE